MTLKLKWRFPV